MRKPVVDIAVPTPVGRLKRLEELWESLAVTPDAGPLTDAQRAGLDRRLADLDREGPIGIPWDAVLQQVRSPTG